MKYIKPLILFLLIVFSPIKLSFADNMVDQLKQGGKIVLIRHAYAPGSGDPDNFLIKDCSTQRNLSKEGINQSKAIGIFFHKNQIPIDIILSSEWCRCKDTAEYAFDKYETKSFLNSFFSKKFSHNKSNQIKELKEYVENWNSKKNLVLITHFVVISELLDVSASSGEVIITNKDFEVLIRVND